MVISLWTLILAYTLGTGCCLLCSSVVRYFTSLFIKNQEGSILQWNLKNNSGFNLTCISFMRGLLKWQDFYFHTQRHSLWGEEFRSAFTLFPVMKELLSVADRGCQDFTALNRLLAADGKVNWINLHWNNSLYFESGIHLWVLKLSTDVNGWMKLYSNLVRGISRACTFDSQAQKASELSKVRLNAPDPKSTEIHERFSVISRHSELRPKLVTEIENNSWPSNLYSNCYFRLLSFLLF